MFYIFLILSISALCPQVYPQCTDDTRPLNVTDIPSIVVSPNYPEAYPADSLCEWILTPGGGLFPAVNFIVLETESCSSDVLEAFDGPSADSPSLGTRCGDLGTDVEDFKATGPTMFLRFMSDSNDDGSTGFQSSATTYDPNDPCSENGVAILDDPEGFFVSPDYPSEYPDNQLCQWLIQGPEGTRVELDIGEVEMEDCCGCDGLFVYDGDSELSIPRGHWYADDYPPVFRSTSNSLFVVFETDISLGGSGFNATYRLVESIDEPFSKSAGLI